MAFKTVRIWLDDSFYCLKGVTEKWNCAEKEQEKKKFDSCLARSCWCSVAFVVSFFLKGPVVKTKGCFALCLFPDNQVQTCKSGGLQERSWMTDSCLLMLINAAPPKSLTLWDSKKHQTCPSPPVWIYMVAKCSLTPLYRNTCSCFSVLQRMLLRSIISQNFKACQKHSPLEHAAASKCTYIFQMDRKRPSLVLRWC